MAGRKPIKRTIEEIQELAASRGGRCLSTEYANVTTNLDWECKRGHRWQSSFHSVSNKGTWCRKCKWIDDPWVKARPRLTLDDAIAVAQKNQGRCLSSTYTNASQKLTWECIRGHQWTAPLSYIRAGHWCLKCGFIQKPQRNGKIKRTIQDMQNAAIENGGKCLSDEYIDTDTPLLWECAKGHQWYAIPHCVIVRKTWCAICRRGKYHSMADLRAIVYERLGKILSHLDTPDDYHIKTEEKVTFECADGHVWTTRAGSVLHKHWCHECARESFRVGKKSNTIIRANAMDLSKNKITSSRRAGVISNVMKAISESNLPTLDSPLFETKKKKNI